MLRQPMPPSHDRPPAAVRARRLARLTALVACLLAVPATAEAATITVPAGGSWSTAYSQAQPGDTINVSPGTYPAQRIEGDKATASAKITFVAQGAVHVSSRLDIWADHVTVRGPLTTGYASVCAPSCTSNGSQRHTGVRLEGIKAGSGFTQGSVDLVVKDSEFGPSPGAKTFQIGAAPTSTNVTFDNVYFHDMPPTSATQHLECLTISGTQGITIRNSRFERCAYFGILAGNGSFAGGAPDVRNLTLENNHFGRTLCWAGAGGCPASGSEDSNPQTGPAPYSLMFGADPFTGTTTIRNNHFETEPSVNKPRYSNLVTCGNTGVAPGGFPGWQIACAGSPPPSPSSPPAASFSYAPADVQPGEAVAFDGRGSTCADAPCTYSWDHGPGEPVFGTGPTATFTYQGVGEKTPRLTVTDADGQAHSQSRTILVTAAPPPAPACSNGVDDDGDGNVDFPSDLGCSSTSDESEAPDPVAAYHPECEPTCDQQIATLTSERDQARADLATQRARADRLQAKLDRIDAVIHE